MKIYNTQKNRKEEFIPIEEGKVKIYVCGPTVYNFFHLGNARPFVVFDTLRRYFIYKGYDVTFVQNFTDVDDKIIRAANEEGIEAHELSERYIAEYFTDAQGLGIMKADVHPKVSEHIPEIIDMIQTLIDKGYAYAIDGDVYYRVSAFKDYGILSGQSIDDLMSGARIDIDDRKESPLDFALWKNKKEGEPYWESPWGQGRPGWHIECSAMSRKYLGETIDIHGGGADLVFPHHENEIAQSCACSGKKFVNYWMHNGYINVVNDKGEEEKMSKSLGNFFTVRDISEQFDLEVVRMFILSAHYRSPISFSKNHLDQTKNSIERLYNVKYNLQFFMENAPEGPVTDSEKETIAKLDSYIAQFEAEMEDDLNTANALTAIFEMARVINVEVNENTTKAVLEFIYNKYMTPCKVLGIVLKEKELLEEEILDLIEQRTQARKNKDFKRSDEIRDLLKERGIVLEDTREGVKWKRV
ncbi:MAG: cysteine--tRNA ligase [Eubacteriaceae bacterium]|nr:cysteine--tRNA ligase [Eubacteriaceae bacterium]